MWGGIIGSRGATAVRVVRANNHLLALADTTSNQCVALVHPIAHSPTTLHTDAALQPALVLDLESLQLVLSHHSYYSM